METDADFEGLEASLTIEKLEDRYNKCITLGRGYVNE